MSINFSVAIKVLSEHFIEANPKQLEDLKAQIADAIADRDNALADDEKDSETIAGLKAQIADQESQLLALIQQFDLTDKLIEASATVS
jgi:hypothetical protein